MEAISMFVSTETCIVPYSLFQVLPKGDGRETSDQKVVRAAETSVEYVLSSSGAEFCTVDYLTELKHVGQ